MAMNFKQAAVRGGAISCEVATLPKATPEQAEAFLKDNTVTITRVGITAGRAGPYALFVCEEDPGHAYAAGGLFNQLVAAWNAELGVPDFVPSNCEELNAELAEAGGVALHFRKQKNTRDPSKSDYWVYEFAE